MTDNPPHAHDRAPAEGPKTPFDAILNEALESLGSNLDHSSNAILAGLFRKDGHGPLGTFFRALQEEKDPRTRDELWSQLVGLGAQLWDAGHTKATVKLYEDAQVRLIVPETYATNISEATVYAKDQLIFERANARFLDGDDETAIAIALQMSDPKEASELKSQIERLAKRRFKSRKLAYTIAALAVPLLLGATYVGVRNFTAFLQNPPKISMPEVDFDQIIPDLSRPAALEDTASSTDRVTKAEAPPEASPSDAKTTSDRLTDQPSSLPGPSQPDTSSSQDLALLSGPAAGLILEPNASLQQCAFNFRVINQIDMDLASKGSVAAAGVSDVLKDNFASSCAEAAKNPLDLVGEASKLREADLKVLVRTLFP